MGFASAGPPDAPGAGRVPTQNLTACRSSFEPMSLRRAIPEPTSAVPWNARLRCPRGRPRSRRPSTRGSPGQPRRPAFPIGAPRLGRPSCVRQRPRRPRSRRPRPRHHRPNGHHLKAPPPEDPHSRRLETPWKAFLLEAALLEDSSNYLPDASTKPRMSRLCISRYAS